MGLTEVLCGDEAYGLWSSLQVIWLDLFTGEPQMSVSLAFFFSLGLIRFLREDFLVSYLNIYHLAASQSERVGRSQ